MEQRRSLNTKEISILIQTEISPFDPLNMTFKNILGTLLERKCCRSRHKQYRSAHGGWWTPGDWRSLYWFSFALILSCSSNGFIIPILLTVDPRNVSRRSKQNKPPLWRRRMSILIESSITYNRPGYLALHYLLIHHLLMDECKKSSIKHLIIVAWMIRVEHNLWFCFLLTLCPCSNTSVGSCIVLY